MSNNISGNGSPASGRKHKLARFFDRYGVVFALGGCALIIGGTWFFTRDNDGGIMPEQPAITVPPVLQNDNVPPNNGGLSGIIDQVGRTPAPSATAKPGATPNPGATATDPKGTPAPVNPPAANPGALPGMTRPLSGDILKPFAIETLLYSRTLNQWETHAGVDFAAAEGDDILCVLDGEIQEISADALWGNCVAVQHADGLVSRYAGLQSLDGLQKGAKIKKGDVLGKAGGAIACEALEETHLHFELAQNGVPVDCAEIFDK